LPRTRAVLFDLDHTLLDFDRAQRAALRLALESLALPYSSAIRAEYRRINDRLWEQYRRGEIVQAHLARERFRLLLAHLGEGPRRASQLARAFLVHLSQRGDRFPGCRRTLQQLRRHYVLGVVTNGIDHVQRTRIQAAGLESLFSVVVTSEGCGFAKPDPRILEHALDAIQVQPRQALYVGDDVRTDGGAARNARVPFCWMDHGLPLARGIRRPRRRVGSLPQLLEMLGPS
jgi:2-haloacid dehalogenase